VRLLCCRVAGKGKKSGLCSRPALIALYDLVHDMPCSSCKLNVTFVIFTVIITKRLMN
jgi:hypothetical protein